MSAESFWLDLPLLLVATSRETKVTLWSFSIIEFISLREKATNERVAENHQLSHLLSLISVNNYFPLKLCKPTPGLMLMRKPKRCTYENPTAQRRLLHSLNNALGFKLIPALKSFSSSRFSLRRRKKKIQKAFPSISEAYNEDYNNNIFFSPPSRRA